MSISLSFSAIANLKEMPAHRYLCVGRAYHHLAFDFNTLHSDEMGLSYENVYRVDDDGGTSARKPIHHTHAAIHLIWPTKNIGTGIINASEVRAHFCRPCVRMDCRTSACNRIERTQTHLHRLRVNRNCVSIYFVILCDKVMFYAIKWDKFIIRWVTMHPNTECSSGNAYNRCTPARPLNTITIVRAMRMYEHVKSIALFSAYT